MKISVYVSPARLNEFLVNFNDFKTIRFSTIRKTENWARIEINVDEIDVSAFHCSTDGSISNLTKKQK